MSERRDTEHIGAAIQAAVASVAAPPGLRARIAEERVREAPRRRRRQLILAPLVGALAAVVVTVLFAMGGGDPSLDDAAGVALRAPTQGPPAKDPSNPKFVSASIGGIQFPNYTWFAKRWSTVGARRDDLSGRDALTLTYRGAGKHLGYTVVDGKALQVPDSARRLTAKGGMRLAVVRRGDTLVVTWRERGHTCVLASRDMSVDEMVAFATWS
jgi:hypothetical protein